MDSRVETLLKETPGPAPWNWESFPTFRVGKKSWTWRSTPPETEQGTWPMLVRDWDDAPCFVPGFYTYVTRGNEETLLTWRSALTGAITIRFYPVTQLEPVDPNEDARTERDVVLRRAAELVQLPRLAAGTHEGFAAQTLVDVEELLLLARWPGSNESDPALAIYSWRPASGVVTVTPQLWFTSAKHDLGYEWVTKVARDATTSRIRVRLGAFELEDDDMTISAVVHGRLGSAARSDAELSYDSALARASSTTRSASARLP